MYRPNAFLSGS